MDSGGRGRYLRVALACMLSCRTHRHGRYSLSRRSKHSTGSRAMRLISTKLSFRFRPTTKATRFPPPVFTRTALTRSCGSWRTLNRGTAAINRSCASPATLVGVLISGKSVAASHGRCMPTVLRSTWHQALTDSATHGRCDQTCRSRSSNVSTAKDGFLRRSNGVTTHSIFKQLSEKT